MVYSNDGRYRRFLLFGISLFILILVITGFLIFENKPSCLDVQILSDTQTAAYTHFAPCNLTDILFLDGEPAAVDVNTSTVYIPLDLTAVSCSNDLKGNLRAADITIQLFFAADAMFDDLSSAIRTNHPFSLFIVFPNQTYTRCNVIFTTLSVLRLGGGFSHVDEQNREIQSGVLCLWTPFDPDLEQRSVKTSNTQWRIRGSTTQYLSKKSLKLSLKTATGENRNMAFLGLGEDDDWILNAMGFDMVKVREKLFMRLWNDLAANTDHLFPMSEGEYVEVIINGQYQGIYLLQRRLDSKYLGLADEDILLKVTTYAASSVQDAYEIVYSPIGADATYRYMQGIFDRSDCSIINLENYIDTNLFLQFTSAHDNFGLKNMYHYLRYTGGTYQHFYIPWDTDMSFGLLWVDGKGFAYEYEAAAFWTQLRREQRSIANLYPEIDHFLATRWKYLREHFLTNDYIFSCVKQYCTLLTESGAYDREVSTWGLLYDGVDSFDALHQLIFDRLQHLDEHYA